MRERGEAQEGSDIPARTTAKAQPSTWQPKKLIGGKRKATGPPDPENPQARQKPPPKPEGRLKAKGRVTFTGVRETPIPAVPGTNRKPRARPVCSPARPLPPRKGNTKKK